MPLEIVTISDPSTGSEASVAPALGFNLFSFRAMLAGRPVEALWSDPEFLGGQSRPSRTGIPILFPFAGRIRQGRYHFGGQDYELEAADGQGNAIHGFVYTRPWRVIGKSESSVTGEFQASLDDASILNRWPNDFRVRATYSIEGNTLHASYEFANTGDGPLPWWFGTHPYFKSSSESLIRFGVHKRWLLENLIPSGEQASVEDRDQLADGITIGSREFDDVYASLQMPSSAFEGSVMNPATNSRTTIRFGQPFRECVVFIPPHCESICLEPYTAAPNAFELVEQGIDAGLAVLEPGQSTPVSVQITIDPWHPAA